MTGSFSTPPSFKGLIAKKLIFRGVENDPEKTIPFNSSNEVVILSSLLSVDNLTTNSQIKKNSKSELGKISEFVVCYLTNITCIFYPKILNS